MPDELTKWILDTNYIFGIVGLFSGGYDTGVGNPFLEWDGMWVEDSSTLDKRWVSFEFVQ